MKEIHHSCDYCNAAPQSFIQATGKAFVWYCGTGEDIQKGIIRSSLCIEREEHAKTKAERDKLLKALSEL